MVKKKEEIIEEEITQEEGSQAIFLRKVDVIICNAEEKPVEKKEE